MLLLLVPRMELFPLARALPPCRPPSLLVLLLTLAAADTCCCRIPKPFNRLFLLGGWGVAAYAAMKLAGLKTKEPEAAAEATPKAPEVAPAEEKEEVLKDGIDEGFKSADDAMEQLVIITQPLTSAFFISKSPCT